MSIMHLRKTFASGGGRVFEMKFTKCNEKSFIKTVYQNNVTIVTKQCSFSLVKFLNKYNYN